MRSEGSSLSTPIILAILLSHSLAAVPLLSALRNGCSPRPSDFAIVSFLLFYDVGIVLRWVELVPPNPFFQSIVDEQAPILSGAILAFSPWLLRVGAALARSGPARPSTWTPISNHSMFVGVSVAVSIALAAFGLRLGGSSDIWMARRAIGGQLGTYVLLLYLPLYLLGYYVTTQQSQSRRGFFLCLFLAICSACATLPIGQRTTILLPFVVIGLFRSRLGILRGISLLLVGLLSAALLLPIFKAGYADQFSREQLLERTISGDVARDGVLNTALHSSELIGTKVLPHSGAGYIYNLLLFIPRSIVPFKGQATASYFTAWLVGGRAEDIGWGFGIGMIEEISLNFGVLLIPFGLLLYGLLLGWALRLSDRLPALRVPVNLGAVWLCGYHLRAILILFGAMAAVGLACELAFGRRRHRRGITAATHSSRSTVGFRFG